VCRHRDTICAKVESGDAPAAPRRAAKQRKATSNVRYTELSSSDSDGSGDDPSLSVSGGGRWDALVRYAETAEQYLRRLRRTFRGVVTSVCHLCDKALSNATDDELQGFRVDTTDDVETTAVAAAETQVSPPAGPLAPVRATPAQGASGSTPHCRTLTQASHAGPAGPSRDAGQPGRAAADGPLAASNICT
jgi:hypothetical protein